MKDQFAFLFLINIKVSYKVVLSLMVGVLRHVQSTKNNTLAISLSYFKKEKRDKYDFLHENKHQSFLQAGSMIFSAHS